MHELQRNEPEDPEPEPLYTSEYPTLYLLPPSEHQKYDIDVSTEQIAKKETITAIVEGIKSFTGLIDNAKDSFVYCRQKTVSSPHGGMVRLSEYGFFDPSNHENPAKKLYDEELKSRVVGLEIHHPTVVSTTGEIEHDVEVYIVENDADKEYVFQKLIYDTENDSVDSKAVCQKDAADILELLQAIANLPK